MPESLPIRLLSPVITCFPDSEPRKFNSLGLISFHQRDTHELREGRLRQPV
jgi:hypothetical protein